MLHIFRLCILSMFFFALPAYGDSNFEYFLDLFHFHNTEPNQEIEYPDEPIGLIDRTWNRLEREIRKEVKFLFPHLRVEEFLKKLSKLERKIRDFVKDNEEICTNLRLREMREDIYSKSKKNREAFFQKLWNPYLQDRRRYVLSQLDEFQGEFKELSMDFYSNLDTDMSENDSEYVVETFEDIEQMITKCVTQYAQL